MKLSPETAFIIFLLALSFFIVTFSLIAVYLAIFNPTAL